MKKSEIIISVIVGVTIFATIIVGINHDHGSLSAAQSSAPVFTSGVWAIANTSTAQTVDTFELTNTFGTSTNSSANVSTTAKQVLAPNTGRVGGGICNEGSQNVWLSIGTAVTSTPGQSGFFATSTGRLLTAGSCFNLTQ